MELLVPSREINEGRPLIPQAGLRAKGDSNAAKQEMCKIGARSARMVHVV